MADPAKFWNKTADRYARQPIKDTQSYERTLARTRAHLSETDAVLELGCGTGSTALLLAPIVTRILATDLSHRMIEIAREKAARDGVENVRFERADVLDDRLERLEGGPFDVVMGFNLLHLVRDLPGALERVRALLKPSGLFISKTVCLAEQTRLWGVAVAAARLVGLAPYVRCLTVAELEGSMQDAGFEILEADTFPASPPARFLVARRR